MLNETFSVIFKHRGDGVYYRGAYCFLLPTPFLLTPAAHANFEPEKSHIQNGIVTGVEGRQQLLLLLINSSHNRCMLHTPRLVSDSVLHISNLPQS